MSKCWLYIYENHSQNAIYIGIGDSMERVYQKHNEAAEQLRNAPGTVILQTVEPFSTREDALKAEAISIHIAKLSGITVHVETDSSLLVTNIAGVKSTSVLAPAVYSREGTIDANNLDNFVAVTITAEAMDERLAPYGGHDGAMFAPRAQKYWNIRAEKRPHIIGLVALLAGSHNLILGCWEVDPNGEWLQVSTSNEDYDPTIGKRITIPLLDPNADNFWDIKGKRLTGLRGNSGVVYNF